MGSLKTNDNVLLHRVSNECEHDSLYVWKNQPFNKMHGQSCKRNAFKVQTYYRRQRYFGVQFHIK